jgi:hypothetical protein
VRRPPDVVVLDLGLPDMDGAEVIHGLRGWTNVPSWSCPAGLTLTPSADPLGPRRGVSQSFRLKCAHACARNSIGNSTPSATLSGGCWRARQRTPSSPRSWTSSVILTRSPVVGRRATRGPAWSRKSSRPSSASRTPVAGGSSWAASAAAGPARRRPARRRISGRRHRPRVRRGSPRVRVVPVALRAEPTRLGLAPPS